MESTPSKLYKFQKYNDNNLENLRKHQIWFSKPGDFNDPFDSLGPWAPPRPYRDTEDLDKYYEFERNRAKDKGLFDHLYTYRGKRNKNFKRYCQDNSRTARVALRTVYQNLGIACFSEKWKDMLMWGHYTDGHRGFCLEFDTSDPIFKGVIRVNYSESFPVINPMNILLGDPREFIWNMFTVKSNHWAYEKEWRIIVREPNRGLNYIKSSLTGIYLGINTSADQKNEIINILTGTHTDIHFVERHTRRFDLVTRIWK